MVVSLFGSQSNRQNNKYLPHILLMLRSKQQKKNIKNNK